MDLDKGLKTELSAVSGLSGKVFPLTAQEGTAVPYATYSLVGTDRVKDLTNGHDGLVEGRYEIELFHTRHSDLKVLMNAVIAKLKSLSQTNIGTTGPYIQQLDIENELETYENEALKYRGIIEFNIYYNE